jgi:hypothetical protein
MDISVICPKCSESTGSQKVVGVDERIVENVALLKSTTCSFSGNAHIHCRSCGEALGVDIFDGELCITRSSVF